MPSSGKWLRGWISKVTESGADVWIGNCSMMTWHGQNDYIGQKEQKECTEQSTFIC